MQLTSRRERYVVKITDIMWFFRERCLNSTIMQTNASNSIKREAANTVLARLGQEMIEVIKHHLRRSYAISFDPQDESKFSLEQLHFALSVLLGEGHANDLMRQIAEEIKELTNSQAH